MLSKLLVVWCCLQCGVSDRSVVSATSLKIDICMHTKRCKMNATGDIIMQSAIKQFAALSESANPSDDQRDRCDRCGSFFVEVSCQYVPTGPSYWTCKCWFSPPPQLFQKSWTYFCLQFVIVNLDCLYLSLKTKLSQLNKLNEVVVFFFFYWITKPFYQLLWELGAYIIPQFRVYTVPHGNSSTKNLRVVGYFEFLCTRSLTSSRRWEMASGTSGFTLACCELYSAISTCLDTAKSTSGLLIMAKQPLDFASATLANAPRPGHNSVSCTCQCQTE